MKASAELQVRNEDSTIAGSFRGASRSLTQLYSWQLRDWNDVSTSLSLSLRKTEFTEAFQQRGNLNSDVVMVRSQTRFVPLQRALDADLFYSFSNQRSARLERVFVRVAKGDGNYRYLGDRNSNSLADENEFELTRFDGDYVVVLLPGETLYPVADLQASARIRLQPARILDTSSPMGDVLSSLSSETYVRLDERSSDPNTANVYLLRFGRFLDDQNTLSGAQVFTQDLHIYENSTELSLRFRFNQRKGLLQLVSSRERSYARERSVRVRAQLVSEISNQTEYINRRDRVLATVPTSRERDLVSNTVNSDFSYRPERQWEIGFRFETARVVDELRGDQAIADLNEQSVRVIYGFLTRGQLRSEIRREEVILSRASTDPSRVYPFEFTNGRVFGKTFLWSMGFDYRITSNIQLSFQYEGRSEGSRSPVHLARAEARAFF